MGRLVENQYTIYSIDLFYHGKSSWLPRSNPLQKEEWFATITRFLNERQIDNFSLVGFSLGGRFALTLIERFAHRIQEVILIAPDGIKPNRWYWLASHTCFGKYLLKTLILDPSLFLAALKVADRIRLANTGLLHFAIKNMSTVKQRYAVYHRWILLRNIQPNISEVIEECNSHVFSVNIYLGKHDQIVKEKPVLSFCKRLNNKHLHFLPTGHHALINATAKRVAASYKS